MTLNLDELERKAKAASSDVVGPLECTDIGMERTADLEFIAAARAACGGWKPGAMYGAPLVLALIERLRTTEAERDDWRKRWEQEDDNARRTREELSGADHVVLTRSEFDALTEACYTGPRLLPAPSDEVDALAGLNPVARGET